jgi:hypothetical protein
MVHQYHTFVEAQACLQTFLEDVYNAKRLHSSLDYIPPDEFELQYAMCSRLSGLDFLGALQSVKLSIPSFTLRRAKQDRLRSLFSSGLPGGDGGESNYSMSRFSGALPLY